MLRMLVYEHDSFDKISSFEDFEVNESVLAPCENHNKVDSGKEPRSGWFPHPSTSAAHL